ncbi:MAG TPA: phage tail tape measure C-terminal domain-containing protein [Rhizomicrobium sp.]|jgi:phage-related minor tail protein|nr:phage tail tape measure C-terminal domain-containing protein [Rhizomicrobium sp.]
MSNQTVTIGADISPLSSSLDAATKALAAFTSGPVYNASQTIEKAIGGSFQTVETTIINAVLRGEASLRDLANTALAEFDRVSERDFITKPIEGLLNSALGSVFDIGGARAAGGPVAANIPYLVGEHGPELFTPASGGEIAPNANAARQTPTVVVNIQAQDAASIMKSQSQIAAMLTRAVARGQRNL